MLYTLMVSFLIHILTAYYIVWTHPNINTTFGIGVVIFAIVGTLIFIGIVVKTIIREIEDYIQNQEIA